MVPLTPAAASLAFNFASSLGVVLANKAVFKTAAFTYPTSLTALHYAANYLIVLALLARGSFERRTLAGHERSLLLLTTAVWAGHNGLSNLSLEKNSVGLYQIMKIAVTPMICGLEFACYGKRVSRARAVALSGACAGVALATVSDVQFHPLGATAAMASAVMSAVLKVLQTHLLQRSGLGSLQLMHQTWLPQLALLLLCVPLTDGLDRVLSYELTPQRAVLIALSVLFSFLLNLSSLLALGATSAVAVVLLGQCKTLAIILGGAVLFDATPNAKTLFGAGLAMVSIGCYTYITTIAAAEQRSAATGGRGGGGRGDSSETAEEMPLTAVK